MDKTQKRKEQLLKLMQSGGTDKELVVLDEVNALEDKVDSVVKEVDAKLQDAVTKMADPLRGVNQIKIKGAKGDKGDQGDAGKDGRDGTDGKDGIDGQVIRGLDGKDGMDGTNGKNGTNGINGTNGRDGKDGKDGSADTGDQIVEKINTSESLIQKDKIEGLAEIEKLARQPKGGSYSGVLGIKDITAGSGVTIDKTNGQYPVISASGAGSGDVVGPASSGDGKVVLFDGTTGKLVKDSGLTLSGTNTGDETATTIKSALGITTLSGSNTGDQTLNGLLPTQTGHSGEFLTTDGSDASWGTPAGAGTVTTVSVATANGFSGTVANATTTPAITIIAGAITPSTVNGNTLTTGTGTITITGTKTLTVADTASVSGTNTGDQDLSGYVPTSRTVNSQALSSNVTLTTADIADSSNKRYVTDAQQTVIGNTSGTNSGDNATNSQYSGLAASKADVGQTMYVGTTQIAINRASAALTLAGITLTTPNIGTPSAGVLTNATGLPAAAVVAGTLGTGAYVMDTKLTVPQVLTTSNAIAASSNAATVPITHRINTVTNDSAATLTITMTTTSAIDGQLSQVRVLDSSAAAQTITWVNTENGEGTAPTTSNGSTTLPRAALFQYNNATSKWRCIAA